MNNRARLAVSLIVFFVSIHTYSQPDIAVRVLNPVGFMAPGQVDEILVEVVNPVDSGVVIERVIGFSYGFRDRNTLDLVVQYPRQFLVRSSHCPISLCFWAGEPPLRPGESARVILTAVNIPADTPSGLDIGFSEIKVELHLDGQITPVIYYADYDVVRIVTDDGQGDPSIFEDMDVVNPMAGTLKNNLLAEYIYPRQVNAGEPINIDLTLINRGNSPVELGRDFLRVPRTIRSFSHISGEHAQSFHFVGCESDCLLSGETTIQPGESLSFILGSLYYENDLLFEGELILDGLWLTATDSAEREGILTLNAEPVRISLLTANGQTTSRPRVSYQPLVKEDLESPGDSLLIRDPNTGFQWLKLTAGEGYSPEEIQQETRPGGRFSGFNLATAIQVEELILSHLNASGFSVGEYALYSFGDDLETVPAWQTFLGLFGTIPSRNSGLGVIGIVADDYPMGTGATARFTQMEISVNDKLLEDGIFLRRDWGLSKDKDSLNNFIYEYTGYWLVK